MKRSLMTADGWRRRMRLTTCDATDRFVWLLWGRGLRMVLVAAMMDRGEVTVAELVAHVDRAGYRLTGRPSKVISDALRWEVRAGRVERLGRGRYRFVRAPATTARRIRRFGARCAAWRRAEVTGQPFWHDLHDPRAPSYLPSSGPIPPEWPPWWNLGWLWAT